MERPEPKFVPGELVEIRSKYGHPMDGQRVRVALVEWRTCRSINTGKHDTGWKYKTVPENTEAAWWSEPALRRPPKDEPTTFDASIWKPEGVNA